MTDTQTPEILDVIIWPRHELKIECQNVTIFDKDLEHFVSDMFATMTARGGVGLAAPQVGEHTNIITLRLEPNNPIILINPEIVVIGSETFEWEEGCLSVPGYFEYRQRPNRIAVKFNDLTGEEHNVEFRDLYAFAIQHEFDHLKGKCFVDDVSFFKKGRIKKKIKKVLPQHIQRAELIKNQLTNNNKES